MSFEDLLEFQTHKLGYTFKHIEILQAALTHSSDSGGSIVPGKTFRRLKALGNAVLKLVASELVIKSSGLVNEGILSKRREILIKVSTSQTNVAKRLFGEKYGIVRISEGTRNNPTFDGVSNHHEFLKAVFGAVFVDAGCSPGVGIEKCMSLFLKLWEGFGTNASIRDLSTRFPVHRKIREFWESVNLTDTFLNVVENCLGVVFENRDLLCEALMRAAIYDRMGNDGKELYKPNYQRLEFLGDSVLELIITEFMYYKYKAEDASVIVEQTNHEKSSKRLMEVAEQLKFGALGLVKVHENKVLGNNDDILEAVIGAMYVDRGADTCRRFISRKWGLVPFTKIVDKVPNDLRKRRDFDQIEFECRPNSSLQRNAKEKWKAILEENGIQTDEPCEERTKMEQGNFLGLCFDPIREFWGWIERPVEAVVELTFSLTVLIIVVQIVIYFGEPHWNKMNVSK